MAKKPRTKKKTANEASTSRVEQSIPHHKGFHGDTSPVSESIEATRRYHSHYLRAVNSPIRRQILKAITEGYTTIKKLQTRTGLNNDSLEWHLSVLEQGFCVVKTLKDGKIVYSLTQEGNIVDYLD